MTDSALYVGTVSHARQRPVQHRLCYGVFALLLDLDELPRLHRCLRFFSHNRFNLFSFFDRDHGDGHAPLRAHVDSLLAAAGIAIDGGTVRLLCYPRLLGYVFNPLSVYFCYRPNGALTAILYEVSNTFGDRHTYLLPVLPPVTSGAGTIIDQACAKALHVSPFLGMEMGYRFRIVPPGEAILVGVTVDDRAGPLLTATFRGQRLPLTDRMLIRLFFRYPLMTVKVVAGIHWEALRLWRKGAPFHRRLAPPSVPVTVGGAPPIALPAVSPREPIDA